MELVNGLADPGIAEHTGELLAVSLPSWRFDSGAQVLDLCSVPGMRPLGRLSN